MKIGYITTHLGVFGSIRELFENANRLVRFGHEVTIYTQDGIKPTWMLCLAKVSKLKPVLPEKDVLIMMDSPFAYNMEAFENTKAAFKTFTMMGFDDSTLKLNRVNDRLVNEVPQPSEVDRNLLHILKNYTICADGQWQLDYFKKFGIDVGVPVGGINTNQFFDHGEFRMLDVGFSGDGRLRKGTPALLEAMQGEPYSRDFYYGRRYDQWGIPSFLNNCHVFVDNHLRAGWCNPVLEAIACGCVVICNNIPALRDFAIDGETAIVLKDNSPENFRKAIRDALKNYPAYLAAFQNNAGKVVADWDYDIVTRKFEEFLHSKI